MKKHRTKERIGLHPVMMLLVLCFVTIVLSGILSFFDVQATYNRVSTLTGEYVVTTEAVTSLYNLSGLKYIFTQQYTSFANFVVLSHLIIILLGIGIMVKSGFLKTVITMLTKKMKKTTVYLCLGTYLYTCKYYGRSCLYYLYTSWSSTFPLWQKKSNAWYNYFICISYFGSALSVFLTSIDSSLLDYTLVNAYIFDSSYYYFIILAISLL